MKRIAINTDSWHYKIVSGVDCWDIPDDICAYSRRLVWGILVLAFLVSIVLGLVLSTGNTLGLIAACITSLSLIYPELWALPGIAILLIAGFAPPLILIRNLWDEHKHRKYMRHEDAQRGFIGTAWQHFHERTCAKLEFTNEAD
jgi:hypothetical protein